MEKALAVTASTGIAACNIGGCTLHSFAGFGLGREHVEVLVKRISDDNKQRWKDTRILIIDESESSCVLSMSNDNDKHHTQFP